MVTRNEVGQVMSQFSPFSSFQPDEEPWPEKTDRVGQDENGGRNSQRAFPGKYAQPAQSPQSQPRLARALPRDPRDPRQRMPRERQQMTSTNALPPVTPE